MARRDLAGLAALGALGMMMSNKKKQSEEGYTGNPMDAMGGTPSGGTSGGDFIEAGSGPIGDFMSEKEPGWESGKSQSRSTSGRASKGSSKKMSEAGYTANPMDSTTSKKSKSLTLGLNDPGYGDAPEAKTEPVDVTKLSLSERSKLSRERARSDGSKTDTRSVNERMRETFGMKKGGSIKKMASGGMTSSASKRADGIASKGKTRGKLC